MAERYIRVYVKDTTSDMVEIKPEFLFLAIPVRYICTYHRLLRALADFGNGLIKDCENPCKNENKTVLSCWNLFQCALASYALGNIKQADFFVIYVNKQLLHFYKNLKAPIYNGGEYYPIKDGYLKSLISCIGDGEFEVDLETGRLYQGFLDSFNNTEEFFLEDDDLIVTNKGNKI